MDKRDTREQPEPLEVVRMRRAVLAGTVVATLVAAAGPVAAGRDPAPALTGAVAAQELRADFNGDDIDDLAVGVPFEDVGGWPGAGLVNLLEGSAAGGLQGSATLLFQGADLGGVPHPPVRAVGSSQDKASRPAQFPRHGLVRGPARG